MKIVKHSLKNNTWSVLVEHNKVNYEIQIEYNKYTYSDDVYYMGYLNSKKYRTEWITFGYSNYKNNVTYILKSIKEVIEGNYDNIAGVGFCTHSPNSI